MRTGNRMEDTNALIEQRKAKLAALRLKGIDPLRNKFTPAESCAEARARYAEGREVALAGRVAAHLLDVVRDGHRGPVLGGGRHDRGDLPLDLVQVQVRRHRDAGLAQAEDAVQERLRLAGELALRGALDRGGRGFGVFDIGPAGHALDLAAARLGA